MNWRSEIARLYGGQPRRMTTLGLNKAIHLYGLRCHDFLAIIDDAEMRAQTDIRAPSFAQLDHYCECAAVAICRLSVRIFGEETPAGERVAAELGRAWQFTNTFAISHTMRSNAGCSCRARCCKRGVYSQPRRAGYWRSRRFRMSAATWLGSLNIITRLPSRQLPLALARQCARQRYCSAPTAPFSASFSPGAGVGLTSR